MNALTAGKQIVDRARDRGIWAACCTTHAYMNQGSTCEASTNVSCVVACCTGSSNERSNCWEANCRPSRDPRCCRTWLQSSCDACTSSFSVSSEGSKLSAKRPSNASPTPGLNPIGGSLNVHVAQSLGEMTASLAAAASLALSITALSFAQTHRRSLLASFSPLPFGFLKPRRDSHWVTNLDVSIARYIQKVRLTSW